ncbi:aspartyl/asparaginyl beta-hydroxylase domain-containing protein [Pseudoduganella danionis]|nr:aspartyl/asparaginyl beta-hydroxylase domain-containing protein [Pseudoduganella danionis]
MTASHQDATAARDHYLQLTSNGQGGPQAWFGLAQAQHALGEIKAALAALEQAVSAAPDNLQLLLYKGDLLAADGNAPAAAAFYRTALDAAPPDQELPAQLRAHVQKARHACAEYMEKFEQKLQNNLAQAGYTHGREHARFRQSLDLLLGRKQLYLQQPRLYYFPGLPQIQYFEREAFPWLDQVEAATPAIRAELEQILKDQDAFEPYLKPDPTLPARERGGLHNNRDWSAFYLYRNGEIVAENAARCPATMAAMAHVPMPQIAGRAPTVLFSLMRPGAHITPHTGILNTRLICHLPLIVPQGCSLRVGNETRHWEEGKAWVFDDSIEHEAWNRSNETRVILLFETWRPELSESERTLVSTMLGSIEDGNDWET